MLTMLLTAHCTFATTDTPYYAVLHLTDANGLPQNSVKFIAPGNAGFIWLATENGLVRYEGHGIVENFNKGELGIASSRISGLYPGANPGELFCRTDKQEVIAIRGGKPRLLSNPAFSPGSFEDLVYRNILDPYPITGLPDIFKSGVEKMVQRCMIPISGTASFLISRDSIFFSIMNGKYMICGFRWTASGNFLR